MEPLNSNSSGRIQYFLSVLERFPSAAAEIKGSAEYPRVSGRTYFYQTPFGVLVSAQVFGLPVSDETCRKRIFAFHIHDGNMCAGNQDDAFADAMQHYDPNGCEHPYHAGDLLPLWGNNGYAFEIFLTDRFTVNEIIGKTVIVHQDPDDFTTQPSGNAGEKIACGVTHRYVPYLF